MALNDYKVLCYGGEIFIMCWFHVIAVLVGLISIRFKWIQVVDYFYQYSDRRIKSQPGGTESWISVPFDTKAMKHWLVDHSMETAYLFEWPKSAVLVACQPQKLFLSSKKRCASACALQYIQKRLWSCMPIRLAVKSNYRVFWWRILVQRNIDSWTDQMKFNSPMCGRLLQQAYMLGRHTFYICLQTISRYDFNSWNEIKILGS